MYSERYLDKNALWQEASECVAVAGGAARQVDVELRECLVARHQWVVVVQHLVVGTGEDTEAHLWDITIAQH